MSHIIIIIIIIIIISSSLLLLFRYVYQYSVAGDRTKQVVGGRSRLHLIDLGQLERADCKRGRVNIIIIIIIIIITITRAGSRCQA